MKKQKQTSCLYSARNPCTPKFCTVLKCQVLQAHLGMSMEEIYALGLRDRPKSNSKL